MDTKINRSIHKQTFFLVFLALFFILTAPYFISASSKYANNSLIRSENGYKVYYLENGKKRWIDSIKSFEAHNFSWDEVQVISEDDLNSYDLGEVLASESSFEESSFENKKLPQDTAGPIISNIKIVDVANNAVTVAWITDELADSRVNYGLISPLEMASSVIDLNKSISHSITLFDLSPGAVYYYTVSSIDMGGNEVVSVERSFTTSPLLSAPESQNWQNIGVANGNEGGSFPSIAWNSSEYGLVWHDSRDGGELEIYFALLNGNGIKIGKDIKISNHPDKISRQPAMVWTGSEYGIIWSQYSRDSADNSNGCYLYFTRLDAGGGKLGADILVVSDNYGSCPSEPSIVWNGSGYGIVWHETRLGNGTSRIFFTKLNSLGEKQGIDKQIADTKTSENPSIAWSGREYGVVWKRGGSTGSDIYFARLDSSGIRQGNGNVKVNKTDGTSLSPSIIWNGSNYGIIWQGEDNGNNKQIYFTKLDQGGARKGDDVKITSNLFGKYSIYPSFVWNGSEYGVSWQQGEGMVYFNRLDLNGAKKGDDVKISNLLIGQAKNPIIDWNETESKYGIVWDDIIQDIGEIYFATSAISLTDSSQASSPINSSLAIKPNAGGKNYLAGIWVNKPTIIILSALVLSLAILIFTLICLRKHSIKIREGGGE